MDNWDRMTGALMEAIKSNDETATLTLGLGLLAEFGRLAERFVETVEKRAEN